MTTIAWNRTSIAADRQATSNGWPRDTQKLCLIGYNHWFAGAGARSTVEGMRRWLEENYCAAMEGRVVSRPTFTDRESYGVLWGYDSNRKVQVYELYSAEMVLFEVSDDYGAIGSGRDFALAAMKLGLGPREAILIAADFDVFTGRALDEAYL